jgi:Xaa-Pro aminopeptidase
MLKYQLESISILWFRLFLVLRYYEDGVCGIRIENLLEIQDCNLKGKGTVEHTSTKKRFLKFCKLTLIPIQQNLINVKMLTEKELDWLDAYHQVVFEKISLLLEPESLAMKWLEKSCKQIDRSAV